MPEFIFPVRLGYFYFIRDFQYFRIFHYSMGGGVQNSSFSLDNARKLRLRSFLIKDFFGVCFRYFKDCL